MIQKTGSIHVYFQRNKGHLAGVILCSILVGMGETMWAFVFQKIGELPGDMTKAAILRLAVLFCYDSRVAGMVLMTVWIPVAVPFLFGKQISKAEGRVYRSLEQYTGKLKDFFGGFEVIQSFQIEKETEAIFGNYVKDVEESRYHARFCESSGEVLALSLTYGTLFVQILFCAWMAAKGNIPANAMLSILYLLSSINNPLQNAVQAILSVKAAGPNVEKVEKLWNNLKKPSHPSSDRK